MAARTNLPEQARRIREKEITIRLNVERSTIRRWEKKRLFPKRRRFGPACVG